MIVLDANTVIAFLDATDAHHAQALALITQTRAEGQCLNVLTLAEAIVYPAERGDAERAAALLAAAGIEVVGLDRGLAPALATLRAETRLRMPDVVVLHTAQAGGYGLATFDEQLAARAAALGVRVLRGDGSGGR